MISSFAMNSPRADGDAPRRPGCAYGGWRWSSSGPCSIPIPPESWRLRSSRQRLAVSSAGIVVELALAGLAILAWALAPDGIFRQAMLYLATTGWLLTLALGVHSCALMAISSSLTCWIFPICTSVPGAGETWLRKTLFRVTAPDSENPSLTARRALIAFALFTWLYRFTLFLGIAVAVYLLFSRHSAFSFSRWK